MTANGSKSTAEASRWRARLGRIVRWALVIEAAWLLVVNGLLHLPPMQDWISAVRPEKFRVRWERAWSFVPFHVEARGVFANGNAKRQMWQFEAERVAGFINPVPLLWKQVSLHAVSGGDVTYRQRPRPRPDRDYSATEAFFPEIEGREVTPADLSPFRTGRPWRIHLGGFEVEGGFDYWVFQLRGNANFMSKDLDVVAGDQMLIGDLQRDADPFDRVSRLVDNGKSPLAQAALDDVLAEPLTGFKHRCTSQPGPPSIRVIGETPQKRPAKNVGQAMRRDKSRRPTRVR